jgi:hypothetical protein
VYPSRNLIFEVAEVKNAYECKEEYSPDGKRLVRRERIFGGNIVVGAIALAFLITTLILAWTGHASATPISLGDLLDGLARLSRFE